MHNFWMNDPLVVSATLDRQSRRASWLLVRAAGRLEQEGTWRHGGGRHLPQTRTQQRRPQEIV